MLEQSLDWVVVLGLGLGELGQQPGLEQGLQGVQGQDQDLEPAVVVAPDLGQELELGQWLVWGLDGEQEEEELHQRQGEPGECQGVE